jgi:hypothetical protein
LSSLAGVLGDDLLDLLFERDHLASVDLDVCCLDERRGTSTYAYLRCLAVEAA